MFSFLSLSGKTGISAALSVIYVKAKIAKTSKNEHSYGIARNNVSVHKTFVNVNSFAKKIHVIQRKAEQKKRRQFRIPDFWQFFAFFMPC
jgi:cytochrome b